MRRNDFQVRELIALCRVPRKTVEKFLRPLARSGYLRATGGGPARRYTLVRDTGPVPPRVRSDGREVVLDLNLEIVREREHHAALLKEIRRVEARLGRLGAYVEKFCEQSVAR